jgi:Putative zincin peptidase
MPIPGFIITWLTFPGVVIHELAHQAFCIWTGTRVIKVCYFRFGNPAGYVLHEVPSSTWKHILIGIGPLFINTAAGFGLGLAAEPFRSTGDDVLYGILIWLAVAVAMHSFPSTGDAQSIWTSLWKRPAPLLARLIGTPLVGLIYLGAFGSVFWLDLAYGVLVVFAGHGLAAVS